VQEQKRYYWLDWLRFAAAFMVLACHARWGNWSAWRNLEEHYKNGFSWAFFAVTRPALEAVVVFFVLSGFLVGGKALEKIRKGTFDEKAYVVDRVSRIYLPLLPALLFSTVITLICGGKVSVMEFLGNVFSLQGLFCASFAGNAPLWSLAYEVWFYLLAAFVALSFATSHRVRVIALLGVALTFVVFTKLDASMLFCWCLGAISYTLLLRGFSWICFSFGALFVLAGCGLIQILSESILVNAKLSDSLMPSRPAATLILGLGLAFIIPSLAQLKPRSRTLTCLEGAGTKLAAFSYTLYLTHYPLLQLWDSYVHEKFVTLDFHTLLYYAAKLTSCLLVAWLLYLPFEAQTARVRDLMRRRWVAHSTASAFAQPTKARE
jgi:peptidoglycan/LPS O-acetylase OafA/YrhL